MGFEIQIYPFLPSNVLPSDCIGQGRCVLRSDNHFQKGSFKLASLAINRIYLKTALSLYNVGKANDTIQQRNVFYNLYLS